MLPSRYRGRYSLFIILSLLIHLGVIVALLWSVKPDQQEKMQDKTVTVTLKQKEEPKKEEPKKEEPKKEEPKKEEPKKEEPKKEEPKKEEPKKEEPKKAEPKKAEPKKAEPKKAEPKKTEAKKQEAKKQEAKKQEAKKVEQKKTEAKKEDIKNIPEDVLLYGHRVSDSLNYNQIDLQENVSSQKENSKNAFSEEGSEKKALNRTNDSLNELKQLENELGMKMLGDSEMGMAFVTSDVSRRVVNFNSTNFYRMLKDEENRNDLAASLSNVAKSSDKDKIVDLKSLDREQKLERESYLIKGANKIISNIDAPPYDGKQYSGEVKLYVSLKGDFLKIILKPSGNNELDNAVINAIKKTVSIDMPEDTMIALSMRSIAFWYNEETMAGYPNY
jgi:outer membrane biosynthesis protein TonB